jgi:hypothetical protein
MVLSPRLADPADVKIHGAGPRVTRLWVSTAAVNEATEGLLVEVVGTVSQAPTNDLPFGFRFFVNDGSGAVQILVNAQTGIDVSGLAVGQSIRVTGFSSQAGGCPKSRAQPLSGPRINPTGRQRRLLNCLIDR